MFAYLYQWLQNLAFYLVVITAVLQMIPNHEYRKYIRFFTGLVLIVMLSEPLIQAVGMGMGFSDVYENAQYRQTLREIEEKTKYLKDVSLEGLEGIQVEEIQIGNKN